ALAYEQPFRDRSTPSGTSVARWLGEATAHLPGPIRRERLAALREQLIGLFGARATLRDERGQPPDGVDDDLFLATLVDLLAGGLAYQLPPPPPPPPPPTEPPPPPLPPLEDGAVDVDDVDVIRIGAMCT